jgi:hypothetical protein
MDPIALAILNESPTHIPRSTVNSSRRNAILEDLLPTESEKKRRRITYDPFILNNLVNSILCADDIVKREKLKSIKLKEILAKLVAKNLCFIPYRTLARHVKLAREKKETTSQIIFPFYRYDCNQSKPGRPMTMNGDEESRLRAELETLRSVKGKINKHDISILAKQTVNMRRQSDISEQEGKFRASRVGGKDWMKVYLKKRGGKNIKVKRVTALRRLLKSNGESALEDLRQKATFFAKIQIREAIFRGRQVQGTNDVGVSRSYHVKKPGKLVWWGEMSDDDGEPWPSLLDVRNDDTIFVTSLDEPLVGPADNSQLACLDETPFHLHFIEMNDIVFCDLDQQAVAQAMKEQTAWTILLLAFGSGSIGLSLLILESTNKSCKAIECALSGKYLYISHAENGQIDEPLFFEYIEELGKSMAASLQRPIYLQLDGHSTRSTWRNARRFSALCEKYHIFCLFDASAFSQIGQVNDNGVNKIVNEVTTSVYSVLRVKQSGSLKRVDHIEAAATVLAIVDELYKKAVRDSFIVCCFLAPFSYQPYHNAYRFSKGEVLRSQNSMPRSDLMYLKALLSPRNIVLPVDSPFIIPSAFIPRTSPLFRIPQHLKDVYATLSRIKRTNLKEASLLWHFEISGKTPPTDTDTDTSPLPLDLPLSEFEICSVHNRVSSFLRGEDSPLDINELKWKVAIWLLRKNLRLYGGFVRDTICLKEECCDIDCGIVNEDDGGLIFSELLHYFVESNFEAMFHKYEDDTITFSRGPDVLCATVIPNSVSSMPFEIQLVRESGFAFRSVDMSCNVLCISKVEGLHNKGVMSQEVALLDVLRRKFCVLMEPCTIFARIQKMKARGWVQYKTPLEFMPCEDEWTYGRRSSLRKGQIPLHNGMIMGGLRWDEWLQTRRVAEKIREREKGEKLILSQNKSLEKLKKSLCVYKGSYEAYRQGKKKFKKEVVLVILKESGVSVVDESGKTFSAVLLQEKMTNLSENEVTLRLENVIDRVSREILTLEIEPSVLNSPLEFNEEDEETDDSEEEVESEDDYEVLLNMN